MLQTTLGQVLVNESLPREMRDYSRKLDKKGIQNLLQEVAEKYPDQYVDISHKLSTIGHRVAYQTGGFSFGLEDMQVPPEAEAIRQQLRDKVHQILMNGKLSDDEKNKLLTKTLIDRSKEFEDTLFGSMVKDKNPLATQVQSGARGNPGNLRSIIGGDLLYEDHHGRPIPVPILKGYAQGMSPVEYWASSFGTRKGVADLKFATQEAGFFGKQLNQIAHRLIVTAKDHPRNLPEHQFRGLPVDTDDPDTEGALLAQDIGPYKRNTVLTPKMLREMKARGHDRILIRSPLVGGPPQGGLYARDVGVRDRGGLSPIGDYVGMAAAQALCLDADTQVRLANGGTAAIRDLKRGDLVLGCNTNGELRPVRVLNIFDNGLRDCVETTFRLGTGKTTRLLSVCSTLDHKLLAVVVGNGAHARNERRPAAVVRRVERPANRHDRYYAKLSSGYDDTGHEREPFALLLGILLGDGCYTGSKHSITLSCYDPQLIEDIDHGVQILGLRIVPETTPGEYRVVGQESQLLPCGNGTFVRNGLKQKLVNYDMFGKYAHEKVLPAAVYGWDNTSVCALLAGLFATDGCVALTKERKVSVGFASSSYALVAGVRQLLELRCGVYGSSIFASKKLKPDGTYYHDVYHFTINSKDNVERFARQICIPGVKQRKLRDWLKEWPASNKWAEAGRCALVSQVPIGQRHTFDIEVEHPDHLFLLANGLVVSNSEPVTQAQISSKHTGGVAGAGASVSGFKYINQLIQVPKTFQEGASHATTDGKIGAIWNAPAGGKYLMINGVRHYVHPNHSVKVKAGDTVEAGDVLSDGIPNPAEIVRYKGIGDGRSYFTKAFKDIYKASGIKAHRRNVELIARGLINHVRLTDEMGDYAPDDVIPYDVLEHVYKPRVGHELSDVKRAVGKYLERPVLHYSIGTKVRPSMLKELKRFNVNTLLVHDNPPPFEPEMVRGMENLQHDPDWMTRQLGSNLKKNLLTAAHRGATSDELGTSFVPPLARAVDFGRKGLTKGWDPEDLGQL